MNDLDKELLEFLKHVEVSTDDIVNTSKGNLVKNIHKRVQEVKSDISVEVEFMTLLERDGKMEEGLQKGREEAVKQLILKQFNKGLSIEYIAEINEFDVEFVKDVIKNNVPKV